MQYDSHCPLQGRGKFVYLNRRSISGPFTNFVLPPRKNFSDVGRGGGGAGLASAK